VPTRRLTSITNLEHVLQWHLKVNVFGNSAQTSVSTGWGMRTPIPVSRLR
jgi:hypothetical protein